MEIKCVSGCRDCGCDSDVAAWCLWGQKLQNLSRSERQRTFDLETALICGWRTATLDRDYHVYHYMTPSCVHISATSSLFFVFFIFFLTSTVHFRNWFCFLYFAGFPRKLTGKISLQVFSFHISCKKDKRVWLSNPHSTHGFPEEGNGPGLLLCFTVRTSESEPNIQPPTPPCAHMHRMRDKGVPFLRTAHHRLSLWAEQWPFTVGASIGRGSNPYSPEVKTEAGTCSTSSWDHLRPLAVMLQTQNPPYVVMLQKY